ncbi:MAG: M91 family zinc metallopeptidase [Myxococcota bacterium]
MYSDIRLGRSDIAFDPTGSGMSDEDFVDAVMGDIGTIVTTAQGRALLRDLAYGDVDGRSHRTTIGYVETPEDAGGISEGPLDPQDLVDGDGVGIRIAYHPGADVDLGRSSRNFEQDDWARMTSDVAFFHELVHAWHQHEGNVEGTVDWKGRVTLPKVTSQERGPLTQDDLNAPREEWRTVGIGPYADEPYSENAYREERAAVTGTDIPPRDSYRGFGRRDVAGPKPGG